MRKRRNLKERTKNTHITAPTYQQCLKEILGEVYEFAGKINELYIFKRKK